MHEAGDDQVRQERGQLEAGQELLKRLSHVAVAIQLPSSREDRLREFLRGACDVVGFDRAWVLLASADGGAFELVSPAGDADGVPTARLPLDSRAGPFYHAWKSRRPVAVLTHEDVQALPPLAPEYLAHPFFRTRSFVIAPLLAGDRVIGVACADNKPSRRPILPLQVEPFALLCQQVATALDNARLYDEAERRRRQAEVLADLARDIGASLELGAVLQRVVEGARELCGAEAARIALRNAEGDAFTFRHGAGTLYPTNWTIVPGKGLGGRVLETGRPLRTDDYANDPRFSKDFLSMARADRIAAMMAVPILIKDRVEGLIFVDRHEPRPFTEGHEAILVQLAEHAAIATDLAPRGDAERPRGAGAALAGAWTSGVGGGRGRAPIRRRRSAAAPASRPEPGVQRRQVHASGGNDHDPLGG
jgi:GAF domain-containing protein